MPVTAPGQPHAAASATHVRPLAAFTKSDMMQARLPGLKDRAFSGRESVRVSATGEKRHFRIRASFDSMASSWRRPTPPAAVFLKEPRRSFRFPAAGSGCFQNTLFSPSGESRKGCLPPLRRTNGSLRTGSAADRQNITRAACRKKTRKISGRRNRPATCSGGSFCPSESWPPRAREEGRGQ